MQSISLSLSFSLVHKIIKSSQDFVIVSPLLPPSLSSAPHSNIQTNKIRRLLNGTALEPSNDLDVRKLADANSD